MKRLVAIVGLLVGHAACGAGLFSESTYAPLVSDRQARLPGDILTVLVFETSSATASADSDSAKNVDVSVSASDGYNPVRGDLDLSNRFNGEGTLNRTGKLLARVSVTVHEVLENGQLRVSGRQFIEFNNEQQTIEIAGKVRPEDIAPDNTVLSVRLADSEIRYTGEGLLTDSNRPGVLTRLFNWLF